MPVAVTAPLTRVEFEDLERRGGVDTQRFELILGQVVDRMSVSPPHAAFVMCVVEWLASVFGIRYLRIQSPVDVSPEDNPTSAPQPDACVTSFPRRTRARRFPRPSEIRLIVEVAESSLLFDTTVKAELYARAGIPDYWVLDVRARRTILHRDPRNGRYASVVEYAADQPVRPLVAPDAAFLLSEFDSAEE